MQALTALIYTWLAAVLHVLPVVELCAGLNGLGAPAKGCGAMVVGISKVPPPGAPNSTWVGRRINHGGAVAGGGIPGLEGAAGSACRPAEGVR